MSNTGERVVVVCAAKIRFCVGNYKKIIIIRTWETCNS